MGSASQQNWRWIERRTIAALLCGGIVVRWLLARRSGGAPGLPLAADGSPPRDKRDIGAVPENIRSVLWPILDRSKVGPEQSRCRARRGTSLDAVFCPSKDR